MNNADHESIDWHVSQVVEILNSDGVVIMPADTVYGIFAKATCREAVERVYSIKKRDKRKPFVIYTNRDKVHDICDINEPAQRLISSVWPKALSIILNKKNVIPDWFTDGNKTVAVMTAENELISKVIEGVSEPILGTTLNLSGDPEIKTGIEAEKFVNEVDMIVKKDELIIYNKPSTMIDCTTQPPKVARLSSLTLQYLKNFIPELETDLERRIS